MQLQGKITISRTGRTDCAASMRIEIQDVASRVSFVIGEMSMEDFAMAITGHGYMPIKMEIRGLDVVGMQAEHKTLEIPFNGPRFLAGAEENEEGARAAVAAYEVDGWRATDWRNFFNEHRRVHGVAGDVFKIAFHRWVPRPEGAADE